MADSSKPMQAASDAHVGSLCLSANDTAQDTKQDGQYPRIRRRNRIITSCLECRRRKLKCDRGQPCNNCVKVSRQCRFITAGFDTAAQTRLAEVKEKMGILERSLDEEVAQQDQNRTQTGSSSISSRSRTVSALDQAYSRGEDGEDGEEVDIEDLESSLFATEDNAYYEDEEGNDNMVDLGISMGKMRITERIGGLVRPRLSDELSQALKELPERKPQGLNQPSVDVIEWMMPSTDYVAPSSSFFFGPGAENTTLMNYLPTKILVDKLLTQYWQAVHVVARTVHRPSFERHYERFWKNIATGLEPRSSFQAVVFAALLSSVVSLSSERVSEEFGVDKQGLVDNFRQATEMALSRANLLCTTKLETLQAFVMYLIPLCRAEVSRAHSALTGTCIRLAECMGLHRDPTAYNTSPVECQVRRLLWHQICFLDIRTCEATGPRPQIRQGDFDTRLPLNIDDTDLDRAEHGDRSVDVERGRNHFTDMTITRMRFECYDMQRWLSAERLKLERKREEGEKKVTITSLLARIQSFQASMEKEYLPILNKAVPLHALASQMYGILSNRLYIYILQKYLSSDRHKMPDRLREIIMSAAMMIIEHSINIEEQPALSTWSWYIGALHQYHAALLILSELYAAPRTPGMEERAWRCLDFVFELPSDTSNIEKTRTVLEDLSHKISVYASLKRWRAPKDMPQAGPRTHTPGWQLRQNETKERERNADLQSMSSGTDPTGFRDNASSSSPSLQQPFRPPSLSHSQSSDVSPFSGGFPNSDWGTFDGSIPVSTLGFQQPMLSPDLHSMPNYLSATPSGNSMPPQVTSQASEPTNISSSAPVGSVGTAGNSPLDALNEIDWNEIDKLFDGAEVGIGDMMIPPFTFPHSYRLTYNDRTRELTELHKWVIGSQHRMF